MDMRGSAQARRAAVIAVDIGGTSTRVAVVQPALPRLGTRDILGSWQVVASFPTEPRYPAQLARLAEAVAEAVRQAHGPLAGIGVSLGGRIAQDGSTVGGSAEPARL